MTQPEALRLADELDHGIGTIDRVRHQAAAELRRLHELAMDQQGKIYALEMARSMEQKTAKLKRDAMLEALREIERSTYDAGTAALARAAIAKAEEKV